MKTTAQDVMTTRFHTLKPGISIAEAVMQFRKASQEEQQKVFGMMVTDEDELVSTDDVNVDVAKIVPQANAGTNQTVFPSLRKKLHSDERPKKSTKMLRLYFQKITC